MDWGIYGITDLGIYGIMDLGIYGRWGWCYMYSTGFFHFPMQNRLKIDPRISSEVT